MTGELIECVTNARVHRLTEDAVATLVVAEHVRVGATSIEAHGGVKSGAIPADFEVGDHVVDADQWYRKRASKRSSGRSNGAQTRAEPWTA